MAGESHMIETVVCGYHVYKEFGVLLLEKNKVTDIPVADLSQTFQLGWDRVRMQ